MPRYRFDQFVLSPRRRTLARQGQAVPLIPRYFDLLLFLVERRTEAVHRRDIFDRVWSDVIVSDSALSQAIRTLRRTLGDDPRDPQFIRTVSRHGYQFVHDGVIEEDDEGVLPAATPLPPSDDGTAAAPDLFAPLLARLVTPAGTPAEREDQRDAAERLHGLGTEEALRRLAGQPGEAAARALLRDTRHLVPGAGDVPLLGTRGGIAAGSLLATWRMRRVARAVTRRWLAGVAGGALAGTGAGLAGGVVLWAAPGSLAPVTVAPVLAAVGAACGAIGAAGVAAGIEMAEAVAVSGRAWLLALGGAAGGGFVGGVTQLMAQWTLGALFGLDVPVGGLVVGLGIGAGVGLGYAIATRDIRAGLATPRRRSRVTAAIVTGVGGALAAFVLALAGLPLVGGTLHLLAQASAGSQVLLTPLGRLLGEPGFGPLTRTILSIAEGGLFGAGLAFGLTRRPAQVAEP